MRRRWPLWLAIALCGCANEPHRVTWYDDVTGLTIRTDAAPGSRFSLKTPISKHLAIVITPG